MNSWEKSGFYKAYTPTKAGTKEPILAYTKKENQLTWSQCEPYPGVLGLLAEDSVLVDSDEEIHSQNLRKVIEGEKLGALLTGRSGGRGYHALLKNGGLITKNHTHVMLACGIMADIKIGSKNGLECLKFDGEERSIVYDAEEYEVSLHGDIITSYTQLLR